MPYDDLSQLDHGPGVREEDLSLIFKRFYRADASRARSSGGVGLGLSLAQAVVRMHGGTIAVANRPEGGAVSTVRLPAAS